MQLNQLRRNTMRARENLLIAIKSNHYKAVGRLITQVDHTKEIENKKTAIEIAANEDSWESVEVIAKNKNTDAIDIARYSYALFHAVNQNRLETAKILLEAGSLRDWRDEEGDSYLHAAVENENIPMIELLLSFNCAINIKNTKNRTPIQLSYDLKNWVCVETIAKNKRTDMTDTAKYSSALLHSVTANRLDTSRILLEAGALCDAVVERETDDRCLHQAVRRDNEKMIALLLTFNASLEARNIGGYTPRELASKLGHTGFQEGWKIYYDAECLKIITTLIIFAQATRQPSSKLFKIPDNCLESIIPFLSRESIEQIDTMEAKRNSLAKISTHCFINRHISFKTPPSASRKLVTELSNVLKSSSHVTEDISTAVDTFLMNDNNKKLRTYRFLNKYKLTNLWQRASKDEKEKEQKVSQKSHLAVKPC
jgi:hypothetical protein